MSVFYLDTSAWVKRYVQEGGSARIHTLFDRQMALAAATLGYVETVAALNRRLSPEQQSSVLSRVDLDWRQMTRLDLNRTIMDNAADWARRSRLRGADAIHLAVALQLRDLLAGDEEMIFLASDQELLLAAQNAGLHVEDPTTPSPC